MPAPRRRKTARDRFIEQRVAGWINIDVYRIAIPICLSSDACRELCEHEGISWDMPEKTVMAFAGWGQTKKGQRMHYVMLPSDSTPTTWVHEASHLVDFIFDYLGLDPSIEGTEARAYLLEHIYASIEATMMDIQELISIPEIVVAVPYNERPV